MVGYFSDFLTEHPTGETERKRTRPESGRCMSERVGRRYEALQAAENSKFLDGRLLLHILRETLHSWDPKDSGETHSPER